MEGKSFITDYFRKKNYNTSISFATNNVNFTNLILTGLCFGLNFLLLIQVGNNMSDKSTITSLLILLLSGIFNIICYFWFL